MSPRKLLLAFVLTFSFFGTGHAESFTLSSPDVGEGKIVPLTHVYSQFGCTGENISPALSWSNPPEGTKSFALSVYDPDAPTGSGWWHWVVYNIPASVTSLPQGAGTPEGEKLPPSAKQGGTDYGTKGYGGPCPPVGHPKHRYLFTLTALKVEKLEVPDNATAALIGYMVNSNALGKASFTALYGR